VLGAWVVDGEPAGLGIRESDGLITDNLSYFVPHTIDYVAPRAPGR
jgi:glutathionylspermidine synthase